MIIIILNRLQPGRRSDDDHDVDHRGYDHDDDYDNDWLHNVTVVLLLAGLV